MFVMGLFRLMGCSLTLPFFPLHIAGPLLLSLVLSELAVLVQ